ncbi:MAG TPA: divalent metal cation transporter [Ktedonobacterales bacterium]|nr:divalent metal cation transporter [Ktedonobacterales bacterium]
MAQRAADHAAGRTAHGPRQQPRLRGLARKPGALLKALGPGLIAGASDNDPTTVASLAVVGSTTAYGLSWLVVLVIPMLIVVQIISAAVGVVARRGLEDAVRMRYGQRWALVPLALVLAVNLITLGADLEGGSDALSLLTGVPYLWFVVPFAVGVGAFLVWGSYSALQRVLRYVLLIFLAYILSAFLARPNWGDVLARTVIPHLSLAPAYVAGALALLGTTLTAYAYVWETIEEQAEHPPLRRLGLVQVDAGIGMAFSGLIFWFIVIGTGATLGIHHLPVTTSQQAAQALAPFAGQLASALFGIGLLASAVLALPVLAGTSAYVLAEAFGWRRSLDATFHQAPQFYVSLLLSLGVGMALALAGFHPIQLLFACSIAGGLGTPITLALMMLVARDPRVMGDRRIGARLAIAGWAVTGVVVVAGALFLWQTLHL